MSDRLRCEVIKKPSRKLLPCKTLAELVQHRRGLGIGMQQKVNMTTFKPTRESWFIRSGDHSKPGIHMNFCPMCGKSFRSLFDDLFARVKGEAA